MFNQLEAASRALSSASSTPAHLLPAHLFPAMSGCPDCGTMRMIASPAPLGSCPDCGADLHVLPASSVAAHLLSGKV